MPWKRSIKFRNFIQLGANSLSAVWAVNDGERYARIGTRYNLRGSMDNSGNVSFKVFAPEPPFVNDDSVSDNNDLGISYIVKKSEYFSDFEELNEVMILGTWKGDGSIDDKFIGERFHLIGQIKDGVVCSTVGAPSPPFQIPTNTELNEYS